ncbi:MAG: cytochrome c [Fimbriimonadaceae bacterium]|nr:cytochrome c [Chitinophagales bacterium]
MKSAIKIFFLSIVIVSALQSCRKAGGNYPGDEYTYDMIHSKAYETYSLNPELKDSVSALLPVAGTVPYTGNAITGEYDAAKGEMNLPYQYLNTPDDYERAGIEIKSMLNITPEILAEGKHYFDIYCAVCHGANGDGKGYIVTEGKYTAVPPSYFADGYINMSDGKMFHSLTYGKGAMQSYAYALSKEERWKVIAYINQLQDNYAAENKITIPAVADSIQTAKNNINN